MKYLKRFEEQMKVKPEDVKTVQELRFENRCKFKTCSNNSLKDDDYCMKHQNEKTNKK